MKALAVCLVAIALVGCNQHCGFASVTAPEIDPHDAISALTLTALLLILIADRRRS